MAPSKPCLPTLSRQSREHVESESQHPEPAEEEVRFQRVDLSRRCDDTPSHRKHIQGRVPLPKTAAREGFSVGVSEPSLQLVQQPAKRSSAYTTAKPLETTNLAEQESISLNSSKIGYTNTRFDTRSVLLHSESSEKFKLEHNYGQTLPVLKDGKGLDGSEFGTASGEDHQQQPISGDGIGRIWGDGPYVPLLTSSREKRGRSLNETFARVDGAFSDISAINTAERFNDADNHSISGTTVLSDPSCQHGTFPPLPQAQVRSDLYQVQYNTVAPHVQNPGPASSGSNNTHSLQRSSGHLASSGSSGFPILTQGSDACPNVDGNGAEQPADPTDLPQGPGASPDGFRCVVLGRDLPEERNDCRNNGPVEYMSQLRVHHESHEFYYCLKCFCYFETIQHRESHECIRLCVTHGCQNYGQPQHDRAEACNHPGRTNSQASQHAFLSHVYHQRFRRTSTLLQAGNQLSARRRRPSSASGRNGRRSARLGSSPTTGLHPVAANRLTVPEDSVSNSGSESSMQDLATPAYLCNIAVMSRVSSILAESLSIHGSHTQGVEPTIFQSIHGRACTNLEFLRDIFHAIPNGANLLRAALANISSEDLRFVSSVLNRPPEFAQSRSIEADDMRHFHPRPSGSSPSNAPVNIPGLQIQIVGDVTALTGTGPFLHIDTPP